MLKSSKVSLTLNSFSKYSFNCFSKSLPGLRFLADKSKEENLNFLDYLSVAGLTNELIKYLGEDNEWITKDNDHKIKTIYSQKC